MPTKEIHFIFEYLGGRMAACKYEYLFDGDEIIAHGVLQKPMPIYVTPISV